MVDFTSIKRIFDKLDPPADQRGGQPGGPGGSNKQSKFSQGIGNLGPLRGDSDGIDEVSSTEALSMEHE